MSTEDNKTVFRRWCEVISQNRLDRVEETIAPDERATVLRENVASQRVLQHLGFTVAFADVREIPRCGGPSRLGDTFMLERDDWLPSRTSS